MNMRRSVQWSIAGLMLALCLIAPLGSGTHAQAPHRAGLVVRFSDDRVLTRCIEFTEESITGEELLRRAGLRIVSEYSPGLGAAICQIEGVGCNYPAVPCFCQCQGAECVYWAYYYLANGQWVYSGMGVSNRQVRDGDVEGWSWGPGSTSGATAPPVYTLDQICAPPATHTPTATPTSLPTATWTPWPTTTATPLPIATPTPRPTHAPEVQFWADVTRLTAGACTTLRWDVEHADAVYLDGQGVTGHEARPVCPPQTHTYELRVVAGGQETIYRVTIEVMPATPTMTTRPPAVTASPSVPPTQTAPAATPAPPSPIPSPTEAPPTPTVAASPTRSGPGVTPRRVAAAAPVPTPAPPAPADVAFAPPAGGPADLALFGLTTAALAGVGAFALWRRR